MMLILALLILWPLAEIFVAVEIARAIGVIQMLALLIIAWPIGIWALRSQGRAAWNRLVAAVNAGKQPTREVLDGALILLGGTLLIIPGFITDAIGVVLLLAPTRSLARGLLARNLHSRLVVNAARFSGRPYDVDSSARDIDQPRLRP